MSKGKYILSLTGILFLVMLLVSGGTFAYWSWSSANTLQTNVIVKVEDGITMTINPTTATKTGMYPTNDCDGAASMSSTALVTIVNEAGIKARPTFKLKVKSSKALTAAAWGKINYAITETTGTCDSPLAKGTFSTGSTTANTWGHTANISGVTFDAAANTTTTHTYKVWVWVDSTYTATNTGTTVSDPLQNNTITVTWSENSIVSQVSS